MKDDPQTGRSPGLERRAVRCGGLIKEKKKKKKKKKGAEKSGIVILPVHPRDWSYGRGKFSGHAI
jgi:hypothetical protein